MRTSASAFYVANRTGAGEDEKEQSWNNNNPKMERSSTYVLCNRGMILYIRIYVVIRMGRVWMEIDKQYVWRINTLKIKPNTSLFSTLFLY